VRAGEEFNIDDEGVELMYNYSNFRRDVIDSYASRMTAAEMDLSIAVWLSARPWLSEVSRSCPFNQAQLLFYYEAFHSHMKQHRDNNSKRTLAKLLDGETNTYDQSGTCTGVGDTTCQVPGSSVAVFTIGTTAMTLSLRYPHRNSPHENIKRYVIHPHFQMRLGPGTLFILDPHDDVHYTHEASFDLDFGDDNGVRIAYVFRHCQVTQLYKTSAHKKRQRYMHADELEALQEKRKRRKAVNAAAKRRLLFARMF
jgi:hypothetical protein